MNLTTIPFLFGLLFPIPVQAVELPVIEAPQEAKIEATTTISEKIDIVAEKYKISANMMNKIIKCESNYNPKAVNWSDSHKYSKGSHGIAQFSMETIKDFGKEIGIEDADPYNVDQALEVMAYMLSIGKEKHWTCSHLVKIE